MAEKQYKIGEFSRKVNLSSFTLRYYEDEGLIKPRRNQNGQRFYGEQDVKWLKFLLHLKGTGMTMAELKQYVAWRAQGDATIQQRIKLLRRVKQDAEDQIRELENNLAIVNHKIDWYSGKLDETINTDEDFEQYLKKFE